MRKNVPFIAEERVVRRDEESSTHQREGRMISELLSAAGGSSSWEEVVAWPSRANGGEPQARRSATTSPTPVASGGKHQMNVPVNPKDALNPKDAPQSPKETPRARLDWIPIRHGHCLRINVSGNMDLAMRSEWRRLLREMTKSNVGQFEFNLTQTPSLSLSGLGMLLLFREIRKSQRNDIKLCHCNKQIWEMLQLTGMDKYFMIQAQTGANEEDA